MPTPASDRDAMPPPPSSARIQPFEPSSSPHRSQSSPSVMSRSSGPRLEHPSPVPSPAQSPALSFASRSVASSSASRSSEFSQVTKMEIQRLSNHECWACGAGTTQVCYLIAVADTRTVDLWTELGLINFNLRSTANGIALCPTCHTEFDRPSEPGFFFLPVDIQYFIDFELQDRERRSHDHGLRREVPTGDMYRNHLIAKGMIGAGASSGLYLPVFLDKDYLHPVMMDFVEPSGTAQPKQWHGAPLATLRRAFLTMTSSKIFMIGDETLNQLRALFDLYFKPTSANPINLGRRRPQVPPPKRRFPGDDDDTSPSKQRRIESLGDSRDGYWRLQYHSDHTSGGCLEPEWVLGPDSTTEQAVDRFAYLFARY